MCLQLWIFWDTWPKNIYINRSVFCFLGVFFAKRKNQHTQQKKEKKKLMLCHRKCEGVHSDSLFSFLKACCCKKNSLILSWSWFELAFICFCVLACQRTAVGIRRGENRVEHKLLQNRDSLTGRPTAETAGAHGVMLDCFHISLASLSISVRPFICAILWEEAADVTEGWLGWKKEGGGYRPIGVRSGQLALVCPHQT